MALLKRAHGIELTSASSTIEEVVARQFVERLARERGITLPGGDMFAEGPPVKGKKPTAPVLKKPEPAKPAAPTLAPPRLVKTAKPAAPAHLEEKIEAPAAAAPEHAEPVAPPPVMTAAEPPPVVRETPIAAAPASVPKPAP